MPLKHLTVFCILIAGARRVVTRGRRSIPTRHGRLASMMPLGGPSHIMQVLGPLLKMRIHPEIREKRDNDEPLGMDRIEKK
jgi:hypothetical protein